MSNDRIILDEILQQQQQARAPTLSPSKYFELFVTEQVLKDYDLSDEEIESGIIGDSGDGGIDSIYLFVNGEIVREDFDLPHTKKDPLVELVVIQCKTSGGFAETPVERFLTVSDDIFDLAKPVAALESIYNAALCDAIERFRVTYKALAARFPSLRVLYVYACKGDKPDVSVIHKGEKLRQSVLSRFLSASVDLRFLGASELLVLARTSAKSTFTLALAENPVSPAGQVGFVGLVYLRDYFGFITDEKKQLRRQIFEANVRDYQGSTEVNEAIQQTLKGKSAEDFWWLNNGVTILASRASLSAKTLTIEDPQIVNGLQSSSEIFNYFTSANTENDERKMLVRVIVPSDAASRDRIIKATNSQTAVQPASLRATDKIHRDIEEYLRPRGWFYDRRKNYYKNEGKPLDRVIGIPQLAQATMAIVLARPDQARARPSSLLKDDENYALVYSPQYPIEVYLICAEVIKRVEAFLRVAKGVDARDQNNLRFYVAMHATYLLAGKWRPAPKEIAALDASHANDVLLEESLTTVYRRYAHLGASDQVAKASKLVDSLAETFPN
jgi:hypothetical protein